MFFVYALIDPRDDAVRYIGMTNDIYTRFGQHIRGEGNNITKNMWIAELRELNQMVIMRTLEEVETVEEVRKRETHWIQHYLSAGANLLNCTGAKSLTFEDFMSFFQNGTDTNADINDELPQVEEAAATVRQRKGTRNLYTINEAAQIARCSVRTIKSALRDGKLATAKNSDKIMKSSLDRFILRK